MQILAEKENKLTNLETSKKLSNSISRDTINFFTFSQQIPSQVLSQYDSIVQNYIDSLIMEQQSPDNYDYPEFQHQFVLHLVKNHHYWYFFVLRPYIIKTHENKLQLCNQFESIKQILKTSLQPDLFSNLITLALINQQLDGLQWMAFLHMPTLRTLEIDQNVITNLKSLAKCSWAELKNIKINQNCFTQDELNHSFKARYLKNPTSVRNQFTFECLQQDNEMFHLTGFKFRENLGTLSLSSLNSQSVKNRMEQKFAGQNQFFQPTHQSDKIQLKKYNHETKTENPISENVHEIQFLKNSDVSYIANTQDPVWPDEDETNPFSKSNEGEQESGKALPNDLDQRKMIVNCGSHPFNGLGKIIALFREPGSKKPLYHQEGTAFLISYKHIMTAAHTLYRRVDEKDPTKGFVRADDFEFFLGPLFLKPPIVEKGRIQHEGELLANGIKAHVLFMDPQFQEPQYEESLKTDWAVLELELEKQDIRTKQNKKPLKCNFDFELAKSKDSLVTVAGYPRMDTDFETNEQKSKTRKSIKIIRSEEHTQALYFQEMQPIGLSPCKRFLHYEHSVSLSTCGAPLLVYNSQDQRHEAIGVHIGQKGKNCGVGLLLSAVVFKSQIKSLISNNQHRPIDLKRQYWTQFDYAQEIRNMAARQQKFIQYKLQHEAQRGQNSVLSAVAENGVFFPYLHQIKVKQTTQEQLISFVGAAHRFPHLQSLTITHSSLSDRAFSEISYQSLMLTNLKSIDHSFNQITDQGLKVLVRNSKKFYHLQTINFQYNKITGEGLKTLIEKCHKFPCLETLNLSHNKITNKGLDGIVVNGQIFPCLQKVNFRQNQINDQGLKVLVENGHKFPYLLIIDLSHNQITDKGLKALVENGHKFSFLQTIKLRQNQITDKGLQVLVENAHKVPHLKTINLQYNKIADQGLKALVNNGKKFPFLQAIYLQLNQITDDGLQRMIEKQLNFTALKWINLRFNFLSVQKWKTVKKEAIKNLRFNVSL